MGYGGETNAKKLARFNLWMEMLETEEFDLQWANIGRFLVLCGPDRGDVNYLDARINAKINCNGMITKHPPNELIVAVDEDIDALESALDLEDTNLCTNVIYKHAAVLDVAKEYRREFSVVYLDLCSNISNKTLDTAVGVISSGMRDQGMFAMTVMMGRELDITIEQMRKPNGFVTLEPKTDKSPITEAALTRSQYLYAALHKRLDAVCGGTLLPRGIMSYSSAKEKNGKSWGGVPMLTLWGKYVRPHKQMNFKNHQRWSAEATYRDHHGKGLTFVPVEPDIDGAELANTAVKLLTSGMSRLYVERALSIKFTRLPDDESGDVCLAIDDLADREGTGT